MISIKPAIVSYFLVAVTCYGFVADAFQPHPTKIWSQRFLSGRAGILPGLLSTEPVRASSLLALQPGDENQFAPGEDSTTLEDVDDDTDDNDDNDELVSALTEKLEQVEGIWYSDDFYGPHGREWVTVSATLVGDTGTSALVAVKITGDANVPSGHTTWRTKSWPELGGANVVPAEIQVRADPNDPGGFSWVEGKLGFVSEERIVLSASFSPLFETRGTFCKYTLDDEGA